MNGFLEGSLRDSTLEALESRKLRALGLMRLFPTLNTTELAEKLGTGASGLGLTILVYEEAVDAGKVREVAKDLLYRTVLGLFPDGWSGSGEVHAAVKLVGWHSDLKRFVDQYSSYSQNVIRGLTMETPPEDGWLPTNQSDPLLCELFDRYWPATFEHE